MNLKSEGQLVRVPLEFFKKLEQEKKLSGKKIQQLLRQFPRNNNSLFARDELLREYNFYASNDLLKKDKAISDILRLKPTRSLSGVTPVSLLTKPYPCPGKCIFCPNDINMPKSYITSEPGAQRAARNAFDPYLQTYNRILALQNIGHNVEKIELIILGGTWSSYTLTYRLWFLSRCFQAMNDFPNKDDRPVKASLLPDDLGMNTVANYNKEVKVFKDEDENTDWEDLKREQTRNETAGCRNVGLVIETRPDCITPEEVANLRRMGVTKVQLGVQSLDDEILKINGRGITRDVIIKAVDMLRRGGLKIHLHWMPNLYKATPESDKKDYLRLWKYLQPDELKIYPTSIIKGTPLFELYKQELYVPYEAKQLHKLLSFCLQNTPIYCRLSRIIRDIPSDQIEAGNKITNLRQSIEQSLINKGTPCRCIRCREVRDVGISTIDLNLVKTKYSTNVGDEYFISYDLEQKDKLAGFLRLYLSDKTDPFTPHLGEIKDSALIREVHVYGKALGIGEVSSDKPQHLGLGKNMITAAETIAREKGFKKICIIAAIGTRAYYSKLGYSLEGTYMCKPL